MKTSINIDDMLLKRIKQYNKSHRDQPINVSGVCEIALINKLEELNKRIEEV